MAIKLRTPVLAALLTISFLLNLIFFVMVYIQKAATDNQINQTLELKEQLQKTENDWRAKLDAAEALKIQADNARIACEEKLIAASNKNR